MDERDSTAATAGAITVGDLISTSARAVAANAAPFTLGTLLVMSPAIVASIAYQEYVQHVLSDLLVGGSLQDMDRLAGTMAYVGAGSLALWVLQFSTQFLAQAAVMYATVEFLAGRRATLASSLSNGLSRAGVILVIAAINTVAVSLGTLACIVPGIMLVCTLFVAVPAAVVEKLGPLESLQRSADLTQGHRMTIFLAWLAIILAYVVASCLVSQVLSVGNMVGQDPGDPAAALMSAPLRVVSYLTTWTFSVLMTIAQAAVAAVFYGRVRGIRDGVDADAIADVFA